MHMTSPLKRHFRSCLDHAPHQLQLTSRVLLQSLQQNGKVIEKSRTKKVSVDGSKENETYLHGILHHLHPPVYVGGMGANVEGCISTSALEVQRCVAGHWGQLAGDKPVYVCFWISLASQRSVCKQIPFWTQFQELLNCQHLTISCFQEC